MDAAEFEHLMSQLGPWPLNRRVAVAVSGGADSLCLAWLARRWGDPLGLIVDHGLRAGSGAEAREAARILAGFGMPAHVLTLATLKHGSGLAERARLARYSALADAARAAGLCDLLLGHHAADQAETLLIRRESGSGTTGLSGMAAVTETPGLRLVRPLLGVAPGRLRAILRRQGIAWVEDPSNRNPAATRTRMRGVLDDPDGTAAGTAALLAEAGVLGRQRKSDEAVMAAALAEKASIFPEGYALVVPGGLDPQALGALIRMLGGSPYRPGGVALAHLAAAGLRGTLGGVRLMDAGRLGPGTLLVREAAAMQAPVAARRGAVWDGRFRLEAPSDPPEGARMGALGPDAARFRTRTGLPSVIRATLPAVRDLHGLVAVPHLGYFKGWTNERLRLRLCPNSPAAGAGFQASAVCQASADFQAGADFQASAGGDAQRTGEHHVLDEAAADPGRNGRPGGVL